MSALLYLLAIFASTAAVEFCVLRRWFGRRSLAVCIFGGAIPSGIFWGVAMVISIWIGVSAKAEAPPTPSEIVLDFGFGSILWVLIMSVVALIPAGLTAMIYRRFRSEL
jgi:hypothetical protein